MLQTSVLEKVIEQSVLEDQSTLRPTPRSHNRFPLAATLILTSLVDVFSILVIYLLVNTVSAQNEFDPDHAVQLPTAKISEETQQSLMLVVKNNEFLIDQQPVSLKDLSGYFSNWQKDHNDPENEATITIQADRDIDFEVINPILEMASESGIRHFQLAILREDNG